MNETKCEVATKGKCEKCCAFCDKEYCKDRCKNGIQKGGEQMSEHDILLSAIKTFGEREQEEVAIEELAELIQAISHKHRGREHNIAEEIADVEIMLEQLKIINNCYAETARIRKEKIERLYERVLIELDKKKQVKKK